MKRALRLIRRGIPGHPGTVMLIGLCAIGAAAAKHMVGALLMFAVFGPFYLHGAYERGKMLERSDGT